MAQFNALDPANPKGFGSRTVGDRVLLHQALADMEAAVDPAADPAFSAALRDLIRTYADKLGALDALSVAFEEDDWDTIDAALLQWQGAIDDQRNTAFALLEAARPFLTPDEAQQWGAALGLR